MRRWIVRFLVVVALAAGAWALRMTVFQPEPVPVRVVSVDRGDVEETVTNTRAGTVKARRRADLSPEVGGRVVECNAVEGKVVVAGEVLLRIDDATTHARADLAVHALTAAKALLEERRLAADLARKELERHEKLARRGIEPEERLDRYENVRALADAAVVTATAEVAQARAAIDVVKAELAQSELRAPFDGVIAEVGVEIGEWVTPSPPAVPVPAVIDVFARDSLYVSAPIDEVDSAAMKVGQRVRVTLDPHPGRTFPGTVTRVAPYVLDVEEQNRTIEVEVTLDDAEFAATLLPGVSADIEIVLSVARDALRIPAAALLEGDRVLVVEGDVLAERRVEVGIRNWDWVEVKSGLEAGERIALSLDRIGVVDRAEIVIEEGSP